jgi:hypothetical protein
VAGENKMEYTQSKAERFKILLDFFNNDFPVKFPHLEKIYSEDGHTTLCPPSAVVLQQALATEPTLKPGLLADRIHSLDLDKLLVPKPVWQPTQKEKDEAARKAKKDKFLKAHDAGLLNSSKHNRNELDDEFRGGKSAPLPLTEPEKQARNAKAAYDNQIIADVQSRINNYTGATHSKTYAGRDALKQTFVDAMNKRLSAEAVQKAVEAKIDSMAGNNSVR